MVFDFEFLNLELEAAKTGFVPPSAATHPVFQALVQHEACLGRPAPHEEAFCRYMADGASGKEACWGLTPLFRDGEKIEAMAEWMRAEERAITRAVEKRIARFTSAQISPSLRAAFYVGTGDGGFKIDGDIIYLNISTFSCEESLIQTVTHESYHGREQNEEAIQRSEQLFAQEDNYLVPVFYTLFEEGTAEFIGFNGSTTTQYPVFPMRDPDDAAEELKEMLQKYKDGTMTGEALYREYSRKDYCYTAGVYFANSIWMKLGAEGLDRWAVQCDPNAYYQGFLSTPQGAGWPVLNL